MRKIVAILMAMLMVMSVTVVFAGGVATTKETQSGNVVEYKKTLDVFTPEPIIESYLGYQVPMVHGYSFMTEPAVPMLPVKSFSLVIPQTAEIKSIKVTYSTKEELRGDYDIMPVQEPIPIIRNTPVAFTPKNPSIYASSNPYPGKLFEYAGEGNLRDYRILSINVYPLQYNPAGKKLTFYSNIEIEVIYTAPSAKTEKTDDDEFSRMVKAMVENPEDVDTLPAATTEATFAVLPILDAQYVIITDRTREAEFQVLADHKISKGLTAEVVTLSWIADNYNGADTQEQIRNFIIDAEATWGTKWVLLGGDTSVIPHRLAYSDFQSEDEFIPADLYYSDLDGTWDADGDLIYGEVADNIDFYPDVFVGRAPVDTTGEANTFVSKTIAYEQGPRGYETTALFMAEYLDVSTDGAVTKDMIDAESIPDTFSVTKLYESLGNLNKANAMNDLNRGYGIVNHVGHGNVGVIGIDSDALYNADMDALSNNPNNSVFYSMSCLSNAFEQDSFSEHFVLNPNGGGIAYIGNSRYGWYYPGWPGYGPSDLFDKEFFKSLFNEGFYQVGETLADSRIPFIPNSQSGDTVERWIQYSLNLLGDPETKIWTSSIPKPPELSVTVDAPATVNAGGNFTVDATISNSGTETATGVKVTISWIPESGLNTTDFLTKVFGDGDIAGGGSGTVSWTMNADAIGTYTITVNTSAANAESTSGTAVVSVSNYIDNLANVDIPVYGTVTGSCVDTQASDNERESIEEFAITQGSPSGRISYLEHKWTINVTGGSSFTFYIEAHHTANTEGDDFVFAYSTDDSTYTDMVTVTKTADDNEYQIYELPNDLSGTVYIRVRDTDRTGWNNAKDTIYIDHMCIRSMLGPPDTTPPVITGATGDTSSTTGEPAAISATITDVVDVTSASVYYTPIGGLGTSVAMTEGLSDVWSADVPVAIDKVGTITYYIEASDAAGNTAKDPASGTYNITVTDNDPPSAIVDLSATAVASSNIELAWSAAADNIGVVSYNVYRNLTEITDTTGLTPIAPGVTTTAYTDSTGVEGTTYYYAVTAFDAADNEADVSNSPSAVPDATAPIISLVNSTITSTSATITWTTDELSDSLVKYGTASGVYTLQADDAADVTAHSIVLTGLSPDTAYYYVVNSTDPSDNSAESTEYSFTTNDASGNIMHVASIVMSTGNKSAGKNTFVWAVATITIVDDSNKPVEGATVSGRWSNATTDSDSGITDAFGRVSLKSNSVKNAEAGTTFTFKVDGVTHADLTWDEESASGSITVQA